MRRSAKERARKRASIAIRELKGWAKTQKVAAIAIFILISSLSTLWIVAVNFLFTPQKNQKKELSPRKASVQSKVKPKTKEPETINYPIEVIPIEWGKSSKADTTTWDMKAGGWQTGNLPAHLSDDFRRIANMKLNHDWKKYRPKYLDIIQWKGNGQMRIKKEGGRWFYFDSGYPAK